MTIAPFIWQWIRSWKFIALVALLLCCAGGMGLIGYIGSERGRIQRRIFTSNHLDSLADAIVAYRADHGAYPPMAPYLGAAAGDPGLSRGTPVDRLSILAGYPAVLTTPVSYMNWRSSNQNDLYSPNAAWPPAYHVVGDAFIVISRGPNGYFDIDPARDFQPDDPDAMRRIDEARMAYPKGPRDPGDFLQFHAPGPTSTP